MRPWRSANLAAWILAVTALTCSSAYLVARDRDYESRDYFVAELSDPGDVPIQWRYEQSMGPLKDHHVYSVRKRSWTELHLHPNYVQGLRPKRLYKRGPLKLDSGMQRISDVANSLQIKDPLFPSQWHLMNPSEVGHDINVTGAWEMGITGKNVIVAVIDDGLDYKHKDLAANFYLKGSWDFNNPGNSPLPRLDDDRHGTRCAGEIAAVRNDKCGVGVAYDARVAGIRILSGSVTDADEAMAMNYAMDHNHIYSCSWGPSDDGRTAGAPGILVQRAMVNGAQNGRSGLGSIFVFASGNGGGFQDNCNYDGYTNSIYSITVAALDRRGLHPYYSEACSANMVVTYSSGSGSKIFTTDIDGQCTSNHGGTSAAAPIAAGIFALALQARPDLTWRDMQYLVWDTAVPVAEHEDGWFTTAAGKRFNHRFGYGKLDSWALVQRAQTWKLVKPQTWHHVPLSLVEKPISYTGEDSTDKDSSALLSAHVHVTKEELLAANVDRLEHVNVLVDLEHTNRGALEFLLESPLGIVSQLAAPRVYDTSGAGLRNWTFMSVVHWGEPGVGNWTLRIRNDRDHRATGSLRSWQLVLWGEARDPSLHQPYPVPGSHQQFEDVPYSSDHSSPTSPLTPPDIPSSDAVPHRPKPPQKVTPSALSSMTTDPSWSYVPTFGFSSHRLVWLYGSLIIILAFVTGVLIYIWAARRRMRYADLTQDNHEFELVPRPDENDDDDYASDFSDASADHKLMPSNSKSLPKLPNYSSPAFSAPPTPPPKDSMGNRARTLYEVGSPSQFSIADDD